MKQLRIVLMTVISLTAILSCNKDDDGNPPSGTSYRVKGIQNSGEQKTFTYDNQDRITRIDFNGGSYRFTYSPAEITAQVYFTNGTPDPSWKYVFTVANGRISNGRRYFPNGAISREYQYGYDNQQQLSTLVMSLKDFTGDEAENFRYQFFYDGQSLRRVALVRKIKNGSVLENADSSSGTFSYFTGKSFINWKQIGFNFFGAATAGIEFQGQETMPFSFTYLDQVVPSDKAVQIFDTKKYNWNPGTGTWNLLLSTTQTFVETNYEYNQTGQLEKYKNNTITWESY